MPGVTTRIDPSLRKRKYRVNYRTAEGVTGSRIMFSQNRKTLLADFKRSLKPKGFVLTDAWEQVITTTEVVTRVVNYN